MVTIYMVLHEVNSWFILWATGEQRPQMDTQDHSDYGASRQGFFSFIDG